MYFPAHPSAYSSAVCGTHGDGADSIFVAAGAAASDARLRAAHAKLLLEFLLWACCLANDSLPATDDASHAILNCARPMVHVAD